MQREVGQADRDVLLDCGTERGWRAGLSSLTCRWPSLLHAAA